MITLLPTIVSVLLGAATTLLIKYLLNKYKPLITFRYFQPDMLQDELEFSDIISNKLEDIKEANEADKIWVMQFNNGGSWFPSGKSIQKVTMTYESINPTIKSTQSYFQNVPVNLFNRFIKEVSDKNKLVIEDTSIEGWKDFGLKNIFEDSKSKSIYMVSIRTISGKFIGILGIEYVNETKILVPSEMNNLFREANKIAEILFIHLNTNVKIHF